MIKTPIVGRVYNLEYKMSTKILIHTFISFPSDSIIPGLTSTPHGLPSFCNVIQNILQHYCKVKKSIGKILTSQFQNGKRLQDNA
ncbi:hypothetical protein Hanom_Chr13g01187201 [Helianthus anomalus]